MKVMKMMSEMPSLSPGGEDGPQCNLRGLTLKPAMPMGMRARMAIMQIWIRRKKHYKPMMDQRGM
jgi:hypothetical protein